VAGDDLARAGGAAPLDDDDPGRHVSAGAPTALERLLDGLVDYAGLFPPAALSMADAVRNYATYRRSERRAMLGRFVVPAARLDEFVAAARVHDEVAAGEEAAAWPLAVLAAPGDLARIEAFNAAHGTRWRIDTVETKAESVKEIEAIAATFAPRYTVYVEVPASGNPTRLITALKDHGIRAKLRTGGVTTDAFPDLAKVMNFLELCIARRVPFKATAGLHHPVGGDFPLTYDRVSVHGTMYGFLNIFLAAVLLHAGRTSTELLPLLEERDAAAFTTSDGTLGWRGLTATTAEIAAARAAFAGSFGSCSFEEPVRELAALHLSPAPR
jgi:hypothetical protein